MLRPDVDQRKSAILEAAVQVFIDVGFTEMTVVGVSTDPVRTLFGAGQSPEIFVDEFPGGVCNQLELSRADYDRLVAIGE
jgi:hypothetical protein